MNAPKVLNISVGLVLATSLLLGCGQRGAEVDPPTENAETANPSPIAPAPETATDPEPPSTEGAIADAEVPLTPPQAGTLTAQQADAQINLRPQPTTDSAATGYGLVGDAVQLLKTATGADGATWYYVKFDESGAEGWIRSDFIRTTDGAAAVSIDSYTSDELFAVDGGGCGMTLMPAGTRNAIFFNGLPGEKMWMKLNGAMTPFQRTAASGPAFYGQNATQSFVSEDGAIAVEVTVSAGAEVDYEVMSVDGGTLRLKTSAGTTEIAVTGDAGC
ncbi:MAG TPA: SH3 domain-containing protein [Candidatus Obscuribacterales bacterium]